MVRTIELDDDLVERMEGHLEDDETLRSTSRNWSRYTNKKAGFSRKVRNPVIHRISGDRSERLEAASVGSHGENMERS